MIPRIRLHITFVVTIWSFLLGWSLEAMDSAGVASVPGAPYGFSLFHRRPWSGDSYAWTFMSSPLNLTGTYLDYIMWAYNPGTQNASHQVGSPYFTQADLDKFFSKLGGTLRSPNVTSTLRLPSDLSRPSDAVAEDCFQASQCLTGSVNSTAVDSQKFVSCANEKNLLDNPWQCVLVLDSSLLSKNTSSCQFTYDRKSWNDFSVNEGLQGMTKGGIDGAGFVWFGSTDNETFSKSLGRQLLNQPNLTCNLGGGCTSSATCDQIGSWTAYGLGTANKVFPLSWCTLAHTAFLNVNQHLIGRSGQLKEAAKNLELDQFTLLEYSPIWATPVPPVKSLMGLSGIFTILSGFIPPSPYLPSDSDEMRSARVLVATQLNSFFANALASSTALFESKRSLSDRVLAISDQILQSMDDAFNKLFAGDMIGEPSSGYNISSTLRDGAWIDPKFLQNVTDLVPKLRQEVISRAIDSKWKQFSSNKIWVLFVDLGDYQSKLRCEADRTGPQDFKYCDDGGVYYTYNFIENTEEGGGVSYPWGADKLRSLNISLSWVTQASAKSYRAMKSVLASSTSGDSINATALFDFDHIQGANAYLDSELNSYIYNNPLLNLENSGGRHAGSWTLPVCDASTWGRGWNWDYISDSKIRESTSTHPPCLCGPGGNETMAWAKAAGLAGFETFWHRCTHTLEDRSFQWPDGTTEVALPANGDGKPYMVRKPTTA